jgi:hypothetical protein
MVKLPSTVLRGRVIRVHSVNAVQVMLDLRFGVHVEQIIALEIDPARIRHEYRSEAMRWLIRLVGGKQVLVHVDDDSRRGDYLLGRLYLTEKLANAPVLPVRPFNIDEAFVEVTAFYEWMIDNDFNTTLMALALGKGD